MSEAFNPFTTVAEDRATYCGIPTVLTGAEKTAAVTKVRYLERQLFDSAGHIRRGVIPARAEEMAALINNLRQALGWLEIGLDGQWRWPASAGAAFVEHQRVA
jgi:hypothetical protein